MSLKHELIYRPRRLRQKETLREFDASVHEGGNRHTPRETSWMDKIKGLFG